MVCNSAGRFPQIFAAEGSLFDVLEKTAAGVLITSYEDVTTLGTEAGTITRDFTNSRLEISGTGGVVSFEAGPPTGDDIGGAGRLGGRNGTQADTWEIDAATTTFTGDVSFGGSVTIGSAPLDNVLSSGTVTAASELIVPLSESLLRYRLELLQEVPSTTAALQFQFSFDNGATYKSGGSDYLFMLETVTGSTNTVLSQTSSSIGPSNQTTGMATLLADIATPADAVGSIPTFLTLNMWFLNSGTTPYIYRVSGNTVAYGRATHVRIRPSAGTFSCKWRLVSGRGF